MALIICPDCKNRISDRAERCPHCGLPAKYFQDHTAETHAPAGDGSLDYSNLGNILLSFDRTIVPFSVHPTISLTVKRHT